MHLRRSTTQSTTGSPLRSFSTVLIVSTDCLPFPLLVLFSRLAPRLCNDTPPEPLAPFIAISTIPVAIMRSSTSHSDLLRNGHEHEGSAGLVREVGFYQHL
ncbi:hypothetical protein BDM02DRAFT_3107007, partial [Thelephora ganbajun]